MKKFLLLCGVAIGLLSTAYAQTAPTPKAPAPMPYGTAMGYVTNFKANTPNAFAHGYLLEINKVKTMSPYGARVYNGLSSTNAQNMAITPLNAQYKVNTSGTCYMQSDERLCPRFCDIVGQEPAMAASPSTVSANVNTCMECNRYETVNALVVHTTTLNALSSAGYNFVRIYHGMDAGSKRYVVYVPLTAEGTEVTTGNLYVGDNTNTLTNCKYP